MSKYEFTDEELIKRFKEGDISAYNQIVYRYKDRVIRHAKVVVNQTPS